MGKRKSVKQRRKGKNAADVNSLHKVEAARKGTTPSTKQLQSTKRDDSWIVYAILVGAAAVCASLDLVTRLVADEYISKWCKWFFIVLVCINIRTHAQLGTKPLPLRAVMYILCNFAGATTICIVREEVPAYLRSAQPWINVAAAAILVEGFISNSSVGKVRCMWLRGLCAVPVSLWKTKTLGQLIHNCYVTSTALHRTVPMVTADMSASGIMILFLAYVELWVAATVPKSTLLQRLVDIAQHVIVVSLIALVWKTEEASPSLHEHAASVAGGLVLLYNLVKFCWVPLEFAVASRLL